MCVGRDRRNAKREVKEETGETKVLPGSEGCKLGTAMESVTSRHGAKLPRSRLLRNGVTTYLLLRCSASSAGCGGRIGSCHLLCELRIMSVNGLPFDVFRVISSSLHSVLLRCRLRLSCVHH